MTCTRLKEGLWAREGSKTPSPTPPSFSKCQHQSCLSEKHRCHSGAAPCICSRHRGCMWGRILAACLLQLCPSRSWYAGSQGTFITRCLQISKLVWHTTAGTNPTSLCWTWRCITVLALLLILDKVHGLLPQLYKETLKMTVYV